jgi:glycosyltransferase involved in cell wall biosynthesis
MTADVVICTWAGDDPALAAEVISAAAVQAERVVVVDSWPDDTLRRRIADVDAAVVVVAEPGTLLGRGRQMGIEASGARFVAFLDSDARPRGGWLRALVKAVQPADVGVAGGPVLPVWAGRLPRLFDTQPAYDFLSMMDLGPEPKDVPRVLPGNMLVDRELVGEQVFETERGRLDGDLVGAEETMMMVRLVERGGRVVYEPEAVVDHHSPAERLTWRWMWRRAEASGREAGSLDIKLEPLPRRLGWRDRAFLAACGPPYALGRIRARRRVRETALP